MRWKTAPSVAWQMVGPEALLVDVRSGTTLGLNETGSFIWQKLGTTTEDRLAEELATEYGIPIEEARNDVAEFVGLLQDRGFVQRVEE